MPVLFATLAAKLGALSGWWKVAAGAALAAAPCFLVGQCSGARNERTEIAAENARAAAAAERMARAADELLRQRQADSAAAITSDRKALDDATAHIPDQALSARQHARYCAELRRANPEAAAATCNPVQPHAGAGDAR